MPPPSPPRLQERRRAEQTATAARRRSRYLLYVTITHCCFLWCQFCPDLASHDPMTHSVHVHCVHVHCPMSTLVTTNYPPTIPLALLDITQYVTDCARHLKWLRSPLEHTLLSGCLWCGDQVSSSPPHSSEPGSRLAARLLTTAPAGRPPRTEHCLYLQVAAPRPALATSAHRALWPL